MRPVQSAGKRATDTKRGKTCDRYKARENARLIQSAGKRAKSQITIDCGVAPDWLKKQHDLRVRAASLHRFFEELVKCKANRQLKALYLHVSWLMFCYVIEVLQSHPF